ncbi:MAG: DUF554 domain-containing protein [Bacteroidales bacterium]|jgi:uncharacterized membrane protein YqgA involved in biofilm formation|nr:DUF554 domain-containing protein [Bacteroidales bacterium]
MTGTLINAGAVLLGGSIGLLMHAKLPEKITKIVFQAIGLFTVFLGVKMALETDNILCMILSLVLGSIIGQILDIDRFLQKLGTNLYGKGGSAGMRMLRRILYTKNTDTSDTEKSQRFMNGVVSSFLIFCMGSMAILGAIEDGLGKEPNLLMAKSVLDGFASIAFAASMGVGVLFSIIPLLVFQGGISLLATHITQFFGEAVIVELSAVGGILLIGLGFSMLKIVKIPVINMLPALIVCLFLAYFM